MEIALQTIFILFFVAFPGVIFRRFYFQGEFTKQFDSQGWSHSLFLSLVFGLGIHVILLSVFYHNNYLLSLRNCNELLCSIQEYKEPNFSQEINTGLLYWYFILLFIAPILLGFALHSFVRLLNLDIKYSIFRFSNHWHYYFKGEIRKHSDFPSLKDKRNEKVYATRADILCSNSEGANILYTGLLSQYTISKQTGDLDYVYMTLPSKYVFENLESKDELIKKPIPGDCLILSNSNIININLKYFYADKKNRDFSKLFRTILFVLYFLNWIEPFSITRYGVYSAVTLKLIRHLIIFSFINTIHSFISKNEKEVDSRIGFLFLTILCFALYLFSRAILT